MSGPVLPLEVGTVLPDRRFGPIGLAEIRAYAAASGDDNPIHVDEDAARSIGLAGPVVQGMLMMAYADGALADWFPAVATAKLSCRFAQPLMAGDELVVGGRIVQASEEAGARRLMVRLMLKNGAGKMVALGEAALIA